MITSNFITRLITGFASVSCLFVFTATIYAQNAAPGANPPATAKPAKSPAAQPAAAPSTARPAVLSKPLSFRFHEIDNPDVEKMRTQTGSIIGRGKFDKDEKNIFIQYYKEYFFGRWVSSGKYYQVDAYPDTLRKQAKTTRKTTEKTKLEGIAARWNYPCFIEDFRKDLDRSKEDGDPQKILVKIAYDFATEVINSNNPQCTPVLKYNCILLLGNLYYKISTSSSDLPVVFAPAVETLIKIASSTKAPCYMKIGAIRSLNQFIAAETNLSDKQKSDIYNVFLGIVKVKVNPADFASSKDDPTGEGAIWTRNLAIEGLRLLADYSSKIDKTKGFYPGKETISALFQIMNDKSAPMPTRIAALESLGSYNFDKYPELKNSGAKLVKSAASLVVEAIQAELDRKVAPLVWGDDAEQLSRQNTALDDQNAEQVDNTYNAIYLLQRALPAVYALNIAFNGVKSDKNWKGLSSLDIPAVASMNESLKAISATLSDLSKEIMPSNDNANAGADSEDSYVTDKLQEVIKTLGEIQDTIRTFTE